MPFRWYVIVACTAAFFSAGHAEDWSLSSYSHGPRSASRYEAPRLWRETHRRYYRRHSYARVAAPELRDEEPIRAYRKEDDRPRGRGAHCQEPVRGLGTQWIGESGALDAAKKDWMEHVRYDLGESYLDLTNAKDFRHRCGRVSIGEVANQVMHRCEIWARPCKGEMTEGDRR